MTVGRVALVIGAQCEAAGPLSFLPLLAEDLYGVLTDPAIGQCASVFPDSPGLLLDPTLTKLAGGVTQAFAHAQDSGSTLFLAFVGHGQVGNDGGQGTADFYLLPSDCTDPERPTSDNAWLVGARLRELLRTHDRIDGLVVLLDACHSGHGVVEAAGLVTAVAMQANRRFEVLTATDGRLAADGCFTRGLVELMRHGYPGHGDWLTCADANAHVHCPGQPSQYLAFEGRYTTTAAGDPGLWLAPNWRRPVGQVPPPGNPGAALAERLTATIETPPAVEGLVARSRRTRWLCVHGPAGSGKSTLVTALARPHLAGGLVPGDFAVHALVYLDRTTTLWSLADDLHRQLLTSLPGFHLAQAAYRASESDDRREHQPALTQYVVGPLRYLSGDDAVRLVVDGLDQLDPVIGEGVIDALVALSTDADSLRLHLVVTSHGEGPNVPAGQRLAVATPTRDQLARYLRRRHLPEPAAETFGDLCARGTSAWLLASLLAETYIKLSEDERANLTERIGRSNDQARLLAALLDRLLDTAGAADGTYWTNSLLPVLTPLVAGGAGPVIPIELLAAASDGLDGPDQTPSIRDVLARLGPLVVRSQPGTPQELVGLAHPALVDHLTRHTRRPLDAAAGRRLLLNEVEKLAPLTGIYVDNPLYRWAAESEAEFHWHNGQIMNSLRALERRPLPAPRQNRDRWIAWHRRILKVWGPYHSATLTTRAKVARWTGAAGDPAGALDQYRDLLPDLEQAVGPRHPDTLATRANIAACTGAAGDPAGALDQYRDLFPDLEQALGRRHPGILATRANIATYTGDAGDPAGALDQYRDLLPDRERVLGPCHPDTLTTRAEIARWTGDAGDPAGALDQYRDLLPDRERVLGPCHPDTLTTRAEIARWTGEAGDPAGALDQYRDLLPDRERALGPRHPDTLTTRAEIARWTGAAGDPAGALDQYRDLLPDLERVLGPFHPASLATRANIAHWTGESGDTEGALDLDRDLLPDLERVRGPRHPDTLTTRAEIARWTGEAGDPAGALDRYHALLPDRERALGPRHPNTLATRANIAYWTGESGDTEGALDLDRDLLPELQRVLGPRHPGTLATRANIARWRNGRDQ